MTASVLARRCSIRNRNDKRIIPIMNAIKTASIIVLAGLALCPSGAAAEGDLSRGEKLFARCTACHSVNGQKKIGPSLAGVFGRKAGSVEGARHSKALAQSDLVWTEQNLDAWRWCSVHRQVIIRSLMGHLFGCSRQGVVT